MKYFSFIFILIILVFLNGKPFDFTNAAASSSSSDLVSIDDLSCEATVHAPNTIKPKSYSQVLRGNKKTGYSVVFKGITAAIVVIGISLLIFKCIRSIQSDKKSIRRLSAGTEACGAAGGAEPLPSPLSVEFRSVLQKMLNSLLTLYNTGRTPPAEVNTIRQILYAQASRWDKRNYSRAIFSAHKIPDGTVESDIWGLVLQRRLYLLNAVIRPHLEGANPALLKIVASNAARVLYIESEEYETNLKPLRSSLLELDGSVQRNLDDKGSREVLLAITKKPAAEISQNEKDILMVLKDTVPALFEFNNLIYKHTTVIHEAMQELDKRDVDIYKDIIRRKALW